MTWIIRKRDTHVGVWISVVLIQSASASLGLAHTLACRSVRSIQDPHGTLGRDDETCVWEAVGPPSV